MIGEACSARRSRRPALIIGGASKSDDELSKTLAEPAAVRR